MKRKTVVTAAVAAGSLALGVALVALDAFPATRSAQSRAGMEVAIALTSGLAAWLLAARFRAGGRREDLMLACAAGLLVAVEATFSALPALLNADADGILVRADGVGQLAVGAAIAAAALLPEAHLLRRRWCTPQACVVAVVAVPALALLAVLTIDARVPLGGARSTFAIIAHATSAALLAGALGGLAVRAVRRSSELHGWIALACLFGLEAQADALAHPMPTLAWISASDVFGLLATIALLIGAVRQNHTEVSPATRRAVAEERRRIARELHDGLAQELAFIASRATLMADTNPDARRVADAARSALAESRLAITGLNGGGALADQVRRAAERVALRSGLSVHVEVDDAVIVEPESQAELLRIVQEATTNAVKHARASEVRLHLATTADGGYVLRIADDGVGIAAAPQAVAPDSGFGLQGMHERARRAGGRLQVAPGDTGGTVVEVRVA